MVIAVETKPFISLKNVSKSYTQPNGQKISILENINLELCEGEIVALLGASGSGKSTLMRTIAGLIPPTEGQVLYRNSPMLGLNPGVAIVFQSAALYPWLTVLENVELGLKAKGIAPNIRQKKAIEMIDIIGLDGFENAYPKELSGGMRQRVGFARALAVEPELLCMDEPFSALDVLTAENLRTELLDLWMEKRIPTKAILIVTHGIEEAVTLADRMLILGRNPGRIRQELRVTLSHYRDRKSPEFQSLVDEVYKIMTHPDSEEKVQIIPSANESFQLQKYQVLPHVRSGSIAGFLELLENRQDEDLYRIGQELQLDVDDLLPIVEAAKLIGFIELKEGDIHLNAIADRFIQSNVDERKQIIRDLLLANVQLVQHLYKLLKANPNHQIPEDLIKDILANHFSPEEADRQLNTAIGWGRYAELFSYDEPSGKIFLEEP
ncbi:AAA-associated domain-containing protein [Aerosakkonemataceae cyanobacterium BLCC-F50]|uniref:AAA-associated domain-containing protein n=1 Tax=Floridaenema flaviceps BLCC-F50 TaxID=3153642 RepID=A0ABV4XSV9_9CYAN